MIKFIEELKKIKFAYIVLYIISLSLLYKYAYYRAFGINITSFISISDLYTILIDFLPNLIVFIVLICLIFALLIPRFIRYVFTLKSNEKEPRRDHYLILFTLNFILFITFSVYISTTHAFPFTIRAYNTEIYQTFPLFYRLVILFFFIIIGLYTIVFINKNRTFLDKFKLSCEKIILFYLALITFYITGIAGTLSAGVQIRFYPDEMIEFKYEGKKQTSYDSNIVFVGMTNNFIFLFYKDSATSKAFEISKIKNLTFFNGIYYSHFENIKLDEQERNEHIRVAKEDYLYELVFEFNDSTIDRNDSYKIETFIKMIKKVTDSSLSFEDRENAIKKLKCDYFDTIQE